MSRFHSYINSACKILEQYQGDVPFSIFIKHFFSKEKKFGSSDRKQISSLCYNFFRVGLALNKKIDADRLLVATFLCSKEKSLLINNLKTEWNEKHSASLEEKIAILKLDIKLADLFPFEEALNDEINFDQFCRSFIIQPDLFIRIRPELKVETFNKVSKAGIPFIQVTDSCIQYAPATAIENFLVSEKEIVVQDFNSQQVLNYLSENSNQFNSINDLNVWDCCAASGGKSILLQDILPINLKLTVSDVRPAILNNLQQRFKKASIKNYKHFIADLKKPINIPANEKFDIIICDAPCTGSGTWSRTPEQLYFFNPSSIAEFSSLQKNIAANLIPHLKKNGLFFYITCSVFKQENEAVADFIQQELKMKLLQMKNLWGYEKKADSMFTAIFRNSS
jgi:16S rRNA (cytosine967-C5)-methyltransferase